MLQKRKRMNEKFVICTFIEKGADGTEEEQKTIVSKRWVDNEERLLWWPSGANVLRKKTFDPDKDTWKSFKLVKVLLEGQWLLF